MKTAKGMRFLATLVLGLVLVSWTGWRLSRAEPKPVWIKMQPGFTQPILAFEFARQSLEIRNLFGIGNESVPASARVAFRDRLRHEVRLDAVFLLIYAAFLAVFSLELGHFVGWPFMTYAGVALSVFIGYCDGLENEQLNRIITQLDTGSYAEPLRYLTLYTGLKWGALPLLVLVWMPALWKLGTLSRVLFVVAGIVTLLGGAFWMPWEKPRLLEAAALGIFLFIGLLVPYAAFLTWGTNRTGKPLPSWL